jgi:hypothetical protein
MGVDYEGCICSSATTAFLWGIPLSYLEVGNMFTPII